MLIRVILLCSCLSSLVFSESAVDRKETEISGRQSSGGSFFPTEDEPDNRYDFSSVNYVDPQSLYQVSTSISVSDSEQPTYPPLGENRKGIVFDESPVGVSTFQSDYSNYNQQNPYQQEEGFKPSYSDSSSSELSSPFYQNYASTESSAYPGTGSKYPGSGGNKYPGATKYPTRKYQNQYSPSPARYPSNYPGKYQSSPPSKYPGNYPGKYPSNYPYYYSPSGPQNYPTPVGGPQNYQTGGGGPQTQNYPTGSRPQSYPSTAASSNYPNYYYPNRYASQGAGQNYYYNPQTGSYYPGQYQRPTAAQQHASLYTPNKQSPYPYYQPNYAQQFGNYRPGNTRPNSGGLSGIFNNIQNGQFGAIGGQFSKAIEDISANDDLLCVPKLLCQMIGNPRRQSQLPSFLNSPAITGLIAALPSTSPLMIFGRAALLGLAGGEGYCDSAYPRCPRDEEDLLFYLNNHRGGFFRFFNGGGGGFGDENQLQSLQSFQQQNQQNYGSNTDQGLNLLALQALANAINQGGGINLGGGNRPSQNYQDQSQSGGLLSALTPSSLSSLFSGLGGGGATTQRPTQNYQSQSGGGLFDQASISSLVGNLLTGVVGNRFSRRVSKRSVDDKIPEIEPRIVNLKASEIQAEQVYSDDQAVAVNRQPKFIILDSGTRNHIMSDHLRTVDNSEFVIPNTPRETVIKTNQGNLKLSFPAGIDIGDVQPQYQVHVQKTQQNVPSQDQELLIQQLRQQLYQQQILHQQLEEKVRLQQIQQNQKQQQYVQPQASHQQYVQPQVSQPQIPQQHTVRYEINNKEEFLSPSDVAKRLQMLFDNGNPLKLDQNIFSDPQALQNLIVTLRLARILNGSNQPAFQSSNSVNRYSSTSSNQKYSPNRYSSINSNQYNRYTTPSTNYNQNYQSPNRYSGNYNNNYNDDKSHILYITNSNGQIEYTVNEKTGEKSRYY